MKRTLWLKSLVGLEPTPSGVGSRQKSDSECTVCGTGFNTARATCPECGSELFRGRTRTPRALFNMLFVMTVAGFAIVYNVLTGRYPKD